MHADKWLPFFGNNHQSIERTCFGGAGVSFTKHIGKPLSDELWIDLVQHLGIVALRVYKPNHLPWCNHPIARPYAIVDLDENDLIKDISYGV